MKVVAAMVFLCALLFAFMSGCSDEGQQPIYPEEKAMVKKSIEMPGQQVVEAVVSLRDEKPESGADESLKVETAAVEGKGPKEEDEPDKEEDKGFYITKKGESLLLIAGRRDVFEDPLKWPILYRLNRESLGDIGGDADSPEREIPAGTRLRIITPDQAGERLKKEPKKVWVINVLSSPEKGRVVPNAIRLIKNGHSVYITRTKVKGKDWMRLRVGFFSLKKDAQAEGKKIMALINLPEVWITNVGEEESREFDGYY